VTGQVGVVDVTDTIPDPGVIQNAVMLACRAPSLHNSQPWRWIAEGGLLHLFADRRRLMHATDGPGREMILSCGAALDHLRVAMAGAGWDTEVDRFPSRHDPDHLATAHFSALATVTDAQRQRVDAIHRRRTDRLPFAAPRGWDSLESLLRRRVVGDDVTLYVIPDDARPQLAEASRLTETLRRFDPSYQSELRWWTSPFELDQGVPSTARVSASEAGHIDVARAFPLAGQGDRRPALDSDRSKILVMSTHRDTRPEFLRCGEALSMVLLECTIAGLATCTLTHMIEVTPSRELIRGLTRQTALPQLLIRVGRTPTVGQHFAATPRRPVNEVLEFRNVSRP
jgi:hypothetical protein